MERGGEVGGEACEGCCTDGRGQVAVQGGKMEMREFGQSTEDLAPGR